MLKIKGWSQAHDENVIEVIETIVRHEDPANNSNKFRRFLSVWAPGERPYVFTHTGRWTSECDRGRWTNVGTFRAGDLVRVSAWNQSCRAVGATTHVGAPQAHMQAHDVQVRRKLGEYVVTRSAQFLQITNANVQDWLRRADAIDSQSTLGTGTPVPTPPPATTPAPKPAPSRLNPHDVSNSLVQRVQNALQRSAAQGADPFDVMADISALRDMVTTQLNELQDMVTDLSLANLNAMERI